VGHAIDHMFLLIFATAVTTIAAEFALERWEDLMPYSTAAFFFFGIGALPAGRLGDHWGRRAMMIVFFLGMGAAAILVSAVQSPLQLALALALLGCFAAIYHPVGIPMLLQGAKRPGWVIGVNGFSGNLGVALAAVITGFLVKEFGWRMAFAVPGAVSIACGIAFWLTAKVRAKSARSGVTRKATGPRLILPTLRSTAASRRTSPAVTSDVAPATSTSLANRGMSASISSLADAMISAELIFPRATTVAQR